MCLVPNNMATPDTRVGREPARHCHGEPVSAHIWQGVGEGPFRAHGRKKRKGRSPRIQQSPDKHRLGKLPRMPEATILHPYTSSLHSNWFFAIHCLSSVCVCKLYFVKAEHAMLPAIHIVRDIIVLYPCAEGHECCTCTELSARASLRLWLCPKSISTPIPRLRGIDAICIWTTTTNTASISVWRIWSTTP